MIPQMESQRAGTNFKEEKNLSDSKGPTERPKIKGPAKPAHIEQVHHDVKSSLSSNPQNDSNILEGGDYIWVPPKKQSGDGKTSLNEKYGY